MNRSVGLFVAGIAIVAAIIMALVYRPALAQSYTVVTLTPTDAGTPLPGYTPAPSVTPFSFGNGEIIGTTVDNRTVQVFEWHGIGIVVVGGGGGVSTFRMSEATK